MSAVATRDTPAALIVALCAGLTLAGAIVGFAFWPGDEGTVGSLWATICSAAGVGSRAPSTRPASAIASRVSWTAATVGQARNGDAAHGAFIGGNCVACHGAVEMQSRTGAPSLAGLGRESVYKEMIDYRAGRRTSPVMQAIALSLSDADQADVAAWADELPKPPVRSTSADAETRRLVLVGDPARGIGACAACHGPTGIVPGAPSLEGLSAVYFTQQMLLFAEGGRSNDLNQQMRSVARYLTSREIASLSAFYTE